MPKRPLNTRPVATVPLVAALAVGWAIGGWSSPCYGQSPVATRAAGRAAASGRTAVVRALSDTGTHNITDDLQEMVALASAVPGDLGASGPATLAQALARARARREKDTTAAQRAALAASPMARSARSLQGVAAAAVADGRPTAALAAMLLAQEKAPKDPAILVSLAGLLARMGMPQEALGLLDASDRMPGALPSPMGISGRAIALNNRGYALLLLKRWADAEPPLRKAMELAPLLSEAPKNLALALAELGKPEEAKRVLYFGAFRSRGPAESSPGKADAAADQGTAANPKSPADVPVELLNKRLRRPINQAYDLSAGLGTNLPAIHHPANSAEVHGFDQMLRRRTATWSPVSRDLLARSGELRRQLKQRPDSLSKSRAERIMAIITGFSANRDAEMTALVEITRRVEKKAREQALAEGQVVQQKVRALVQSGKDSPQNRLPIYNDYVDRMHEIARRVEGAKREEWSAEYQRLTGLAANLSDKGWHELAVLHIKREEGVAYNSLLSSVHSVYAPGQYIPLANLGDPEGQAEKPIPSCPASLKAHGLDVDLEIFSIKFSCEKVEVGVSTEGWLAGFAKVEFGFEGDISVMAGAKAEAGIEGVTGKMSVEDGVYITVDRNGLKDVGFRVTFEQGVEVAPGVTLTTELDSMDFSFVPSVASGRGY
jgi:Flp pilus assembly protein TadD